MTSIVQVVYWECDFIFNSYCDIYIYDLSKGLNVKVSNLLFLMVRTFVYCIYKKKKDFCVLLCIIQVQSFFSLEPYELKCTLFAGAVLGGFLGFPETPWGFIIIIIIWCTVQKSR